VKDDPPGPFFPVPDGAAVGNSDPVVLFGFQDVEGKDDVIGKAAGLKINKTVVEFIFGIGNKRGD
jgi:hypothetical protein